MVATQPKYWTYEDLFELPENRRYEIIEGGLYEMPAPGWEHAVTIVNLLQVLLPVVAALGGQMVTAPVDVFMTGANPVQPDIIVLLKERLHLSSTRGVEGAPDLVVEIISPSNPERDIKLKRRIYAVAGVREYWLVHPERRWIEVLTLDGARYRTHIRAAGNELVTSPLLPALTYAASRAFGPLRSSN